MSAPQETFQDFQGTVEIRKIVGLIFEKRWILIAATMLGIGAGVLYLKLVKPTYRAEATVEVLLNNRNLAGMEPQRSNAESSETLATTEANLLRKSLFQKVMERDEISNNPGLDLPAEMGSLERAEEMMEWTSVRLRRGSRLIDIGVEHTNPEVARTLANAIFEEYLKERALIESGSSKSAFEMLLVEKREIDTRLEELEANQQAIEKVLQSNTAIQQLQTQIDVVQQTKGPLHPEVKALNSQLAGMFDELEILIGNAPPLLSEKSNADEEAISPFNGGSPARERNLLDSADALELVQLSLLRDIESERTVGEVIVARLKEAEITIDIQSTPLTLVEPAFTPSVPVSPQPIKAIGLATMLGGGIGMLAVGGLCLLNRTLTSVDDAERLTDLPILGLIPRDKRVADVNWLAKRARRNLTVLKSQAFADAEADSPPPAGSPDRKTRGGIEPLVLLSSPGSPVAESFRTLRAVLGLREGDQQTCMVTSGAPNEGKSFVAANLAVAMALQGGQRVLLIDADLRRPSTQVIFDLQDPAAGLSDALCNQSEQSMSYVQPSGITNLDIMTAGSIMRNPAELLSSPALPALLTEVKTAYHRIVIDTPPINAVADGMLLAQFVDYLMVVARIEHTRAEALDHAVQCLTDAGHAPAGLVLNHVVNRGKTSSNRYSSRDASMFQKYGENYG